MTLSRINTYARVLRADLPSRVITSRFHENTLSAVSLRNKYNRAVSLLVQPYPSILLLRVQIANRLVLDSISSVTMILSNNKRMIRRGEIVDSLGFESASYTFASRDRGGACLSYDLGKRNLVYH